MPDKVTMDEQAMLNRERQQLWWAIMKTDRRLAEYDMGGFAIMQITVQSPLHTGGDYRGIVKGATETGQRSIAFVNGPDLAGVLQAIGQGLDQGTLRWKEDIPYDQRQALGKGSSKAEK
jgi:hypothetical protein